MCDVKKGDIEIGYVFRVAVRLCVCMFVKARAQLCTSMIIALISRKNDHLYYYRGLGWTTVFLLDIHIVHC